MKNLKYLFAAFILAFTLSTSVRAGEMPGAGFAAVCPAPVEGDGEMPGAGLIAPATEIVRMITENILSIL